MIEKILRLGRSSDSNGSRASYRMTRSVYFIFFILSFLLSTSGYAIQLCEVPPAPGAWDINDNGEITIPVTFDVGEAATDAFAVGDVNVDITHEYAADLGGRLIGPDATNVHLWQLGDGTVPPSTSNAANCGNLQYGGTLAGGGYNFTISDSSGSPALIDTTESTYCIGDNVDNVTGGAGGTVSPYTFSRSNPSNAGIQGTALPIEPLSTFVGKPVAGTWGIFIKDSYAQDVGTVNEACIDLAYAGLDYEVYASTNATCSDKLTSLTVNNGDTVYICYEVYNKGTETFDVLAADITNDHGTNLTSLEVAYGIRDSGTDVQTFVRTVTAGSAPIPNLSTTTLNSGITATGATALFPNTETLVLNKSVSVTVNDALPTITNNALVTIDAANVSSFPVSGVCTDNGDSISITLTDSDSPVNTVVASTSCSGGTYSVSVNASALIDGSVSVASQIDDGANPAVTDTDNTTKDSTLPTITNGALGPITNLNQSAYPVTGVCSENGDAISVTLTDADSPVNTATSSGTCTAGTYSINVDASGLIDGTVSVESEIDDGINTAVNDTDNVNKDSVLPTITNAALPAISDANQNSYPVSGTCTNNGDAISITLTDADSPANTVSANTTCSGGTYSSNINASSLIDGAVSVASVITDGTNVPVNDTDVVTKDTVLFSITHDALPDITNANEGSYPVTGVCAENGDSILTTVTDSDSPANTASNTGTCTGGVFSITVDASGMIDGAVTVESFIDDGINAATSDSDAVNKDSQLPTITNGALPAISNANQSTYPVAGSCTDNGDAITVTLTDSDSPANTVTAAGTCSTGSYSIAVDASGLIDGSVDVQSEIDDGINAPVNDTDAVAKDVVLPTITHNPLVDINATNANTYPVAGSCTDNGDAIAVTLTDADSPANTATASGTCAGGAFSINVNASGLIDGAVSVESEIDDGVNMPVNDTDNVNKDAQLPTITNGALPAITSANQASYPATGSCTDNGDAINVTLTDSDSPANSATASGTCSGGSYAINVDATGLIDGSVDVESEVDDGLNAPVSDTDTVDKDVVLPTITNDALVDINVANASSYPVSGICTNNGDAVNVTLTDADSPSNSATASGTCTGGTYTINVNASTLIDGTVSVESEIDDGVNPAVTDTDAVDKDVITPAVAITTAPIANDANQSAYTVSGGCTIGDGDVTVDIAGATPATQDVTCSPLGEWTATFDVSAIPDGPNTIDIDASQTDASNNTVTDDLQQDKDTGIPTVAITTNGSGVDNIYNEAEDSSVVVTGSSTGVESGQTVTITFDDGSNPIVQTTAAVQPDGSWTAIAADISGLASGLITVTADVSDVAQNPAPQASDTATLDNIAPVLDALDIASTSDTTPELTGTSDQPAGAIVEIYDGLTLLCSATVVADTPDNTWACIPATPLSEGVYAFTAQTTDTSGNETTDPFSVTVDLDADDDGIPDSIEEGNPSDPTDTDGDGTPDYLDTDSDNDGIPDSDEDTGLPALSGNDTDGDGIDDAIDADVDGDNIIDSGLTDANNNGINDASEPNDTDGDGLPDYLDPDADGDGIPDIIETATDSDGDSTPDYLDTDSDNDGIPDNQEDVTTPDLSGIDDDFDGIDDAIDVTYQAGPDLNGNGINDDLEPTDTDGDTVPDHIDPDSDGDGLPDAIEAANVPDLSNIDSDNDGIDDAIDVSFTGGIDNNLDGVDDDLAPVDTDGDNTPDYLDTDSDDDGILDEVEVDATGIDTDGDGIDDAYDADADGDTAIDAGAADANNDGVNDNAIPTNTDTDAAPDYLDLDSDNDGVNDVVEAGLTDGNGDGLSDGGVTTNSPTNTDLMGDPDFRDLDSDGDGNNDIFEAGLGGLDVGGDGVIDDATDTDGDGIPDVNDGAPDEFGALTDTDGDGIIDSVDPDDDNDGIPDSEENVGVPPLANNDDDGDGIDDSIDVDETGGDDANNDGIDDALDGDADDDGIPDTSDPDSDNDGIPDVVEGTDDSDGDGLPDYVDNDSDNDGILDGDEDMGVPVLSGNDTDADGIDDAIDADVDGDGNVDSGLSDSNNNGINDVNEPSDMDQDGTPDYLDLDTDGDGVLDVIETDVDTDGDGTPDYIDIDSDNDGISDADENSTDTSGVDLSNDSDGDGIPDAMDVTDTGGADTNNNGIDDTFDATDSDNDGTPDHIDPDSDDDGIPDSVEAPDGLDPVDTDGDGIDDYIDTDSDNDGILDQVEADSDGADLDNDGIDDAYDADADGDDIIDAGAVDADNDGVNDNVTATDTDGDNAPDYLDLDADNDGINDVVEAGLPDENDDGLVDDGSTTDNPPNTDSTGEPDFRDLDSDDDGTNDIVDAGLADLDADGDGRIDDATDSDGDGVPDVNDGEPGVFGAGSDTDGDGIPNSEDVDDDNDGIPDSVEGDGDSDGDGIADQFDLDSDNDGIPDVVEGNDPSLELDSDGDGMVDNNTDSNGDGLDDRVSPDMTPIDTDNDGEPDFTDVDSDGDGLNDFIEAGGDPALDADGDGQIDSTTDIDGDGLIDIVDTSIAGGTAGIALPGIKADADGDGIPNYQETDSDNDGIADNIENGDFDGDGTPDNVQNSGNLETAVNGAGSMDIMIMLLLVMALCWRFARHNQRVLQTSSVSLLLATALFIMPNVQADELGCNYDSERFESCWYGGLGLGVTQLDPQGQSNGWSTDDDGSSGYKIFLGQHFKPHWFWEFAYTDAGEAGMGNVNPVIDSTIDGQISYSIPSLMAGYYFREPEERFNMYVKAGLSSISNSANNASIGFEKQSSVQFALGLGAIYRLGDRYNLGLNFDSFDKDANYVGLSLGVDFGSKQSSTEPKQEAVTTEPEVQIMVKESKPVETVIPVQAEPVAIAVQCVDLSPFLTDIRFDSGSANLTFGSQTLLNQVADQINSQPVGNIEIQAHTDAQGAESNNQKLSDRRAQAVMNYLIAKGVDNTQLSARGYGESIPIASNDNADGRAQNRRVELSQLDNNCQ